VRQTDGSFSVWGPRTQMCCALQMGSAWRQGFTAHCGPARSSFVIGVPGTHGPQGSQGQSVSALHAMVVPAPPFEAPVLV
jgi:hypothetical protein